MALPVNLIVNADSYKASHWLQYPKDTMTVHSYIEPRTGGKYADVMHFGLQMFLKDYLHENALEEWMINEASELIQAHGEPFNEDGWRKLLYKYDGRLPLEIRAIPEGMVVPEGTAFVTVENTDPEFYWLTSYIETALIRGVWYPSSVATISWHIRKTILKFLEETGDPNLIDFKLHDFGARGVSSRESAYIGGTAHAVSFNGSDTMESIQAIRKWYNYMGKMPVFSIPAAEHSSITTWGQSHEIDAYKNMLSQFAKPGALFAVVSDSYNIWEALKMWKSMKKDIERSGATLVIRPDSGDPATIVLQVVKTLYEYFGGEVNKKGFIVLHPSIRVIQGDGINSYTIHEILSTLKNNGFSADNVAFGMGGALLQQVDRDTQRFAMKASYAYIKDQGGVDVFKNPVTDNTKVSKKGLLTVIKNMTDGKILTVRQSDVKSLLKWSYWEEIMRPVYINGRLIVDEDFDTIRQRARSY